MTALDDEAVLPILDRVAGGTITVRDDKYEAWAYYDDGHRVLLIACLLDRLVEQGYCRWDSMIGEPGHLRVRPDGIRAVTLDDRGRELRARLHAQREARA